MADIPTEAIEAAAEAIMDAQNANDGEAERWEARNLARAALEAASPLLAEAWGLADLQAEHEAWQRIGERGRRLRDEFWRDVDARNPAAENVSAQAAATGEDGEP